MASASPGRGFTSEDICSLFSSSNTDEKILGTLVASHGELDDLMRSTDLSDETCGLLIHLFARVSSCNRPSNRQNVLDLLKFVGESPILDKRGADLLLRKQDNEQHSYACILRDYISVLQKINTVMPASMVSAQKIGLLTLLQKQVEDEEKLQGDEDIKVQLNYLHSNILVKMAEKAQEKKSDRLKRELPEDKWKPPDDFRNVPVLPVENDLIYETLFLRKNKAIGRYNNLDHYLDVQFRLYKEDCVVPLREAYEEFIYKDKDKKHFRMDSGRIYRDIKIWKGTSTSPEHGEVFIVELSIDHRKRIKWTNSRRLTFGALLIMSFDRFKSTFFAVIADSDPEHLKNEGLFKVKIYRTRQNQQIPRDTPGIILEATSAYFEAYYHVLLALQSIGDFLPFERYIVDCNKHIDLPKYLAKDPERAYDLMPIISGDVIGDDSYRLRRSYPVTVADTQSWPTKEHLRMDESQRKAFISALTKEFVLIQGPPGTGKTYLGLQIAKALLHNRDAWQPEDIEAGRRFRNLPIDRNTKKPCLLVVCYTNHALDQFIEGIINFLPRHKREIHRHRHIVPEVIRIGSRCKNEVVEKFSIKNFRYMVKEGGEQQQVITNAEMARQKVLSIRAALKAIQGQRIVVSLANFQQVMEERHAQLFNNPANTWLDWLNASEKKWSEGTQKKKQNNKSRNRKSKQKEEDNMADVIAETEYEVNERSLDEDSNFEFDENILGVNVDKQLQKMLTGIIDVFYQERLREEAELTLDELREGPTADDRMMKNAKDLWKLNLSDRWKMYRYWLRLFIEFLKNALNTKEEEFNKIFEEYRKAKAEIDEAILRRTSVIAITTTGAAKYHDSLMKIGPQITIIEEAAEVPEAHIVTAINPDCEHLILIGDHKQLEPKPAVRKLATKFNLSISLFERMLNNGLHYNCLERQHRMRPEISELVRHIYPVLEDNYNVHEYEDVGGISHNLFFVSHECPEQFNEDGKSFSNEHEAEYAKHLCTYLLKQGYQRSEITIIAAYTGQMFLLRSKMPRGQFEGVNICVLDNYQGEENEIVILSLVRSNEFGDIGFLRRENRICVALSRAKKGLYVLGNSQTLAQNSQEWKKIITKIETTHIKGKKINLLGKCLPLYCQNHPEIKLLAALPKDFQKAPEGGCERKCEMRLDCGHVCRLHCHPYDRDHEEYECRNTCYLRCPEDHACRKACHFPKSCNCSVIMNRHLECGHFAKLECHLDPAEYDCKIQVQRELDCGHSVTLACHVDYSWYRCTQIVEGMRECGHDFERKCFDTYYEQRTKCYVRVKKSFPECQHSKDVPCYEDLVYHKCTQPVKRTQECGHVRILSCSQWNNYVSPCEDKCEKSCINDHICQRTCHFPAPCSCKVRMNKTLPGCNHIAKMQCCEDVKSYKDCSVEVKMTLDLCGHSIELPCKRKTEIETVSLSKSIRHSLEKDLQCNQEVELELSCGHEVTVKCWEKIKLKRYTNLIQLKYNSAESILGAKCTTIVYFKLKCGHLESAECWQKGEYEKQPLTSCLDGDAGIKCKKMVSLDLKCGHAVEVECWKQHRYTNKQKRGLFISRIYMSDANHNMLVDELGIKCKCKVDLKLDCDHVMEVMCWERYKYLAGKRSDLNFKCQKDVFVNVPICGHTLNLKCFEEKSFSTYDAKCTHIVIYKYDRCGHSMLVKCFENQQYKSAISTSKLIPPCKEKVKKLLPCGHSATFICSSTDKFECTEECKFKLLCGHLCVRACKICQENKTHKECQQVCEQRSFCGHQCSSQNCMKCMPCTKKCAFRCSHSVCSRKCTEPCPPCDKPCSWKCKHFNCTMTCSEVCNRPRCEKKCDNILPCGHKCSGFCGEPCPINCKGCDSVNFKIDVREKSGAITVTLVECGHSFEYQYLDRYMEDDKNSLITTCPHCNEPIYNHPRYNKILKTKKTFIEQVKDILSKTRDRNLSNTAFPICDAGNVQQFHSYVGKFMTFLQLTKYTESDKKEIAKLDQLQSKGKHLLNKIERTKKMHLQAWIDLADEIVQTHFVWMAHIISKNVELIDKRYMVKLPKRSFDVDNVCENTRDNDISYWSESNSAETTKRPSVLENITGREVVSDLLNCRSTDQKNRCRLILRQIQHFTDIPQVADAMMYPKLMSVIGTHARDWKICIEGKTTEYLNFIERFEAM